ncbi:hypothetical protein [Virgisporangium aurantiacum]|uniref:DUF4303 domain-containing protein n=1 Tax=Virgisporangium aurantiacum TaxID=175570 RepID=A0A8J3Z318_9ACTN|nr:hypothetical protein [Virgisporangium aurantiacum]GIJ56689.1 hypothetical protein Vau01_042050 [Virgisporangium aurantiacum]
MDWTAFETAWHDTGCRTVADLAAAHPDERLYAAAFHLFYNDGAQILPPALAANTEGGAAGDRFAPPEWRWDVLDAASEAMRPWYLRLTDEFLTGADDDEALDSLDAAHDAAMARVCLELTATARRGGIHAALPPGFVVVILEGQRGDEEADLIRASVAPDVLATVPGLAGYLRELGDA